MMETDDDDWPGDDYGEEPGYEDLDLTFLEACMDADLDALAALVEDNLTEEEINERDRCGRTGLSHLCSTGLAPALEMLIDLPELDVNLPDKEGNTPLILAAQAGHTNAVRTLLQHFKGIRIDQPNRLGMTALMKAAIQGRTDCSRLLLYAGADPKLRDTGRKLCAEEWAAYCGRRDCADAIAKFSNTKSFYLKAIEAERSSVKRLERSNSLPELAKDVNSGPKPQHKRASLRKKIKKKLTGADNKSSPASENSGGNSGSASSGDKLSVTPRSPFAVIARCVSTPVLPGAINSSTSSGTESGVGLSSSSRQGSMENIPRVEVTTAPREEGVDSSGTGGRTLRGRRRILQGSSAPVRPAPPTTEASSFCGNSSGFSSSSTSSPSPSPSPSPSSSSSSSTPIPASSCPVSHKPSQHAIKETYKHQAVTKAPKDEPMHEERVRTNADRMRDMDDGGVWMGPPAKTVHSETDSSPSPSPSSSLPSSTTTPATTTSSSANKSKSKSTTNPPLACAEEFVSFA